MILWTTQKNVSLEKPLGWRNGADDPSSLCYTSVIYDLIYFLTRTGRVGRTWKDYCFTADQTTLCLPFQSMRLPELKVLKETQDILIGDLLCLNNREVIRVISAVEQLSVRHRKDLCYKETENADFMFFFIIFVTWTSPFYSFFFSHLFFPS